MKKIILISGASTGIGKSAALSLAQEGFEVWAGVRKPQDAQVLQSLHPCIIAKILDITKEEQIQQVVSELGDRSLYGLFNNAGIVLAGPLELLPMEEYRHQFEVNVLAQIQLTQYCLPFLRREKNSRIVFTGSQSGYFTKPYIGPYSATKFALEALVDSLRVELAAFEIKVSLLQPGVIQTPIWEKSVAANAALEPGYSKELLPLYLPHLRVIQWAAQRATQRATAVTAVDTAVVHAFTSSKPKIRYRIGWDAKIQFLLSRIMPYAMRDFLILKGLNKLAKKIQG